jgi:hypothetical protein
MKEKSIYNYIAGVMLLLSILCLGLGSLKAQVSGAGRVWQGATPPPTPSTSFSKNRDVWQDTINNQSYVYNGINWRLSPTQLGKGTNGTNGTNGANGVNGINGRDGVDGVCPSCPPSTGGSANVGNVRWVTTWSELSSALTDNNIRSINLANNITQSAKVRLPANLNTIKEINGHGFDWVIPSTVDTGLVRTYASLSEANAGIDMQLRLTNISFKGSGRNNVALSIQASYGSRIEGCRFYDFKTAFYGGWTMGTIIDQCFFWENNTSIDFDYARFSGGSNSASQSNHSSVSNCKFRHSAGQFAAIKATAVSGLVVYHNIFEGIQSGSQYHVYFDDNGSPVVKEFNCYGNHVEQQPSIASFYVRLKDGNAYVGGVYSQYDCTLIKFESAGYAKMIVENIPYLTSGTKFENTNGAGRWKFINLPATFLITDATKWVGTPPINSAMDGWQTNGQSNYLQGTTIK